MSSLRQALLERGMVGQADLDALEAWGPYAGLPLAERVFRSGLVGDNHLVQAYESLGATDITGDVVTSLPQPAALGALTNALADKHRALPVRVEGRRLIVALLDPSDTNTLEKLSFYCGLVVEPRAIRARVLFDALHRAYGVAVVRPDGAFLESRRFDKNQDPEGEWDEELPGPSGRARHRPLPLALDPGRSPLAGALAQVLAEHGDVPFLTEERAPSLLELPPPDRRPAQSPSLGVGRRLSGLFPVPSMDLLAARDSLPPQVLGVVVPPLRSAVLFLRRGNVAVGWDGRGPRIGREDIRDVLLPLTAPSVLCEALAAQHTVLGNPRDPTTMERTLFRFLQLPPPRSFGALPIVVGDAVVALLYVDRDDGVLDAELLADARQVGTTLADGLAPFVAGDVLFGRPRTVT